MVVRKYTYLIETNLKATLRKTLHDFSVMSWISCQRYSSFLQRVLRISPGLDNIYNWGADDARILGVI